MLGSVDGGALLRRAGGGDGVGRGVQAGAQGGGRRRRRESAGPGGLPSVGKEAREGEEEQGRSVSCRGA